MPISASMCGVHEDAAIGESREFGEESLRLAERIREQQRRSLRRGVLLPPRVDFARDRRAVVEDEARMRERRLGDERVAPHDFERWTGRIRLALVVAGNDPDAAVVFDAHLRRAENVTGGMERHARRAQRDDLPERNALDLACAARAFADELQRWQRTHVARAAGPHVVAVRMRDHGEWNAMVGIDVEVARRAVKTGR
jgi:hypothetical protein